LIALLDYGSGNLRSAERALLTTGAEVKVTSDFETAMQADGLVVPGVGAFRSCMAGLQRVRGPELIRLRFENDRPTLGICIGLQILFASSDEDPNVAGVGIFADRVRKLNAPITPHMGWNRIASPDGSMLFSGIEDQHFYFVHSYAASSLGESTARTAKCLYGESFIAAIEFRSLAATQFHPEKSGSAGLRLLENWASSIGTVQNA